MICRPPRPGAYDQTWYFLHRWTAWATGGGYQQRFCVRCRLKQRRPLDPS